MGDVKAAAKPLTLKQRQQAWEEKRFDKYVCTCCGTKTSTYPGEAPRGRWESGPDGRWFCGRSIRCRPARPGRRVAAR
jgi:hypothetical protein